MSYEQQLIKILIFEWKSRIIINKLKLINIKGNYSNILKKTAKVIFIIY